MAVEKPKMKKTKAPAIKKQPGAKEMAAFGRYFTKSQWKTCCESPKFVEACLNDLSLRRKLLAKS